MRRKRTRMDCDDEFKKWMKINAAEKGMSLTELTRSVVKKKEIDDFSFDFNIKINSVKNKKNGKSFRL